MHTLTIELDDTTYQRLIAFERSLATRSTEHGDPLRSMSPDLVAVVIISARLERWAAHEQRQEVSHAA